jgi:stage V sporulation protein R
MKVKTKLLSKGSEWTFDLLKRYECEIARLAKNFGLDTYPNQIELISARQMMAAYAASGMPLSYNHWSFGKHYLNLEKNYKRGSMGLAYEIVINSNPCISYLMEENTITMQAIVIAHACYGHNSFFKNNYLFKTWTNADAILDYLVFAKKYIADCEEKHGIDQVEEILDACHALMNYGVDRYKHPNKLSIDKEKLRQNLREEYYQSQVNALWRTIPRKQTQSATEQFHERFPSEPHENILYFIEKNAPLLETWERELVRIVRKIAQYFYPQRQTQVMNEGWACFWHYTLINALYDDGLVTDEFMIEFLQSHTNVIYQPSFDDPRFTGINSYTLGFSIYSDIRRICEYPTDEDKAWFPQIAGTPWLEAIDFAMRNFKDESFIAQYLSPKVIRDLKLFSLMNDESKPDLEVCAIHDDNGYQHIRQALANQYNLNENEPNIQVYQVDRRGDRSLLLQHIQHQQKPLQENTQALLMLVHRLWRFNVRLETVDNQGQTIQSYEFPSGNGANSEI